MRVCPKCGYHESPIWRPSIAHREIDFCRFEDFQQEHPKLAEKLLESQQRKGTKNVVEDEIYAYHLTKGGNVERQAKIDNPAFRVKWLIPVEAAPYKKKATYIECLRPKLPQEQRKL